MNDETDSSASTAHNGSTPPAAAHEHKPVAASANLFQALLETAPDAMVVVNRNGWILLINQQAERMFGFSRDEMLGRSMEMLVPKRIRAMHEALRTGYFDEPRTRPMAAGLDLYALRKDGHEFPVEISLSPLQSDDGLLMISSIRDVSERRAREDTIRAQAQEILEMATVPVVQIWDGIVMVPLIGMLDSQRTQQLMDRLLERVSETASPVAVLDITGVPTVDTQTAQNIIETIAAVRLLGADVVLSGVRPAIAQTLVHLGIDLSNIVTRGSLAAGLGVAFDMLRLRVAPKQEHAA